MGTHYNQLTLNERYQIQALNELNYSGRQIAISMNRSNKTISNELNRCNATSVHVPYNAEKAHDVAQHYRHHSSKFHKRSNELIEKIDLLLDFGLTPEQLAGRMKLEDFVHAASVQTIYRIIHRHGWRARLPRKGKDYRRRLPASAGVSLIPNRVDIEQRPAVVDSNTELGHWEGDTVYGQDGYFVTLVERVSKTFLFARVKRKTKRSVGRAVERLLKPYKGLCKTITFDNGGEFADHVAIACKLKCRIYFAKPYCSWQRGLSENSNGLLRRYFPKKTKIARVSKAMLEEIQLLINCRPRKALNYWSPYEFITSERVSLIVGI